MSSFNDYFSEGNVAVHREFFIDYNVTSGEFSYSSPQFYPEFPNTIPETHPNLLYYAPWVQETFPALVRYCDESLAEDDFPQFVNYTVHLNDEKTVVFHIFAFREI